MKITCDCGRCFEIFTTGTVGVKRPFWSKDADKLLGKISDKEVAERVGCTVKAAARRRERLGISGLSCVRLIKGTVLKQYAKR